MVEGIFGRNCIRRDIIILFRDQIGFKIHPLPDTASWTGWFEIHADIGYYFSKILEQVLSRAVRGLIAVETAAVDSDSDLAEMIIRAPGITQSPETLYACRPESIQWGEKKFKFIFGQVDIMNQGPDHEAIILVISRNGRKSNVIIPLAVPGRKDKDRFEDSFYRTGKKVFISILQNNPPCFHQSAFFPQYPGEWQAIKPLLFSQLKNHFAN